MTSTLHSPATLAALVRALGGDLYAGGRRALVPAPGHSPADRSVSLLLEDGRLLVHGFGGADWREVLDDLRARGWIDAENRLLEGGAPVVDRGGPTPAPVRAERVAAARRLWDAAGAIAAANPAGLYIASRGVDLAAATAGGALRAHAAAPASAYRNRGPRRPALLAAVSDAAGELTAVEITYLDPSGRRSRAARPSRKLVGVLPAGSAVRLAQIGEAMVVGEGVFTALSAMRRFGLPGWALLSTSNLRRWSPPAGVRRVVVAGDRGRDGERSAAVLRAALVRSGVAASVVLPPAGYGDWNDLEQEEARRKGG
jgi:hypothetical protein